MSLTARVRIVIKVALFVSLGGITLGLTLSLAEAASLWLVPGLGYSLFGFWPRELLRLGLYSLIMAPIMVVIVCTHFYTACHRWHDAIASLTILLILVLGIAYEFLH